MTYCRLVDGKLSPEDADRLVRETIATQRMEGIELTGIEITKLEDLAHGRITKAEYDAWLRERLGS